MNMNLKNLFTLFLFFYTKSILFSQDIHELARSGTVAVVEQFLKKEPDAINRLSDRGITPFILACYRGNNEVAKYLMNNGADVNVCTSEGSAIYGILFKNNTEMLSYILENGISPNDTCQFQQFGTPLHMAMSLKRYELVELLLQYGANTSIPNQEGSSIGELLIHYNDESLTKIFKQYEKN
jgi:ankyrin repeat protein